MTKYIEQLIACLDECEVLILEDKCSLALDRLKEFRQSRPSGLCTRDKARYYGLLGRCYYEQGEYERAIEKARVAIRLLSGTNLHSEYAELKYRYGRMLIALGRYTDAAEEINESYAFFRRARDYEGMALALNCLAQIHFMTGNLKRSSEVLELSIKHIVEHSSQRNVDTDKRNLARVLLLEGNVSRALMILDSISESLTEKLDRADAERLYGYAHLLLLDTDLAEQHLKESLSLYEEIGSKRQMAVCFEYLAQLEYSRGNYDEAREYCRKVLDMPEPTASAVAQTTRMLTEIHVVQGDLDSASGTAANAEKAIRKINERIELGALYRVYGLIYAMRDKHEKAREYFRKSVNLLREIGARYELALSYLASGQSAAYGQRERMSHLHIARTLFAEMRIPNRVRQIDDAISTDGSRHAPSIVRSTSQSEIPDLIVANDKMRSIMAHAEGIAKSDLSIFLTGQTGTGKDLFAQHIHRWSGRKGDLVMVNTTAIPNDMIEAELFGYKKGSFTGATEDKQGLIETTEGGTLYLNEIADATPEFQVKLLEVLETRTVRRIGENKKRHVNFRLIAATNCDLQERMMSGAFRRDLYYRLNEAHIELPSLDQRTDEIPALVRHFLNKSGLTIREGDSESLERLVAALSLHQYPGNVRELQAKVKELLVTVGLDIRGILDLALSDSFQSACEQLEATLDFTNWNRSRAAWILGVSEGAVRKRITKYGLTRN